VSTRRAISGNFSPQSRRWNISFKASAWCRQLNSPSAATYCDPLTVTPASLPKVSVVIVDVPVEVREDVREVVIVEVIVDVCVVEGDVNSQFKNVPLIWRLINSFIASASKVTRDSPVLEIIASSSGTSRTMWTLAFKSIRQFRLKKVPLYRWLLNSAPSKSVTSRSMADRPGTVTARHESRLAVSSTKLYRNSASWSGPKKEQPSALLLKRAAQSGRPNSVLIRLVWCWHSTT